MSSETSNPFKKLELTQEQILLKKEYIEKYAENTSPLDNTNCISKLFFTWVNPILKISQEVPFDQDMIFKIKRQNCVQNEIKIFQKNFQEILSNNREKIIQSRYKDIEERPNVLKETITKTFRKEIIKCQLINQFFSALEYIDVLLQNLALKSFTVNDADKKESINYERTAFFLGAILLQQLFNTIISSNLWFFIDNVLGVRIVYIIRCCLFEKLFKKPLLRDSEFTIGEISNMNNSDIGKMTNFTVDAISQILLPFEIQCGFLIQAFLTEYAVLPATAILVIIVFANKVLVKYSLKFQKRAQREGDFASKSIWTTYNMIKFIKIEALENFFLDKIVNHRINQRWLFFKKRILDVALEFLNSFFVTGVLVCLFGFYYYFGEKIDVANQFTILQVFNIFKSKIYNSGNLIDSFTESLIAIRRINNFLISDEIEFGFIEYTKKVNENFAIKVENGNFYWIDQEKSDYIDLINKSHKDKNQKRKSNCFKKRKENLNNDNMSVTTSIKTENSHKLSDTAISIDTITTRNTFYEPLIKRDNECFKKNIRDQNYQISFDQINQNKVGQQYIDDNYSLNSSLNSSTYASLVTSSRLSQHSPDIVSPSLSNSSFKTNQILKNINLTIKKGDCVAIIGKVGSGKTSLLNAILGEMLHLKTSECIPKITLCSDSISYLQQVNWIQSKSIRENILFYSEFDEEKYNQALKYSRYDNDIANMPNKDLTILGDKGMNLSGGQRARLSLARCLYANKDIVIMDQPLSALDANIAKTIMKEVILEHLSDKTRIIITSQLNFLKYFDYIYVMKNGEIKAEGLYKDIVDSKEYKEILKIQEKKNSNKNKKLQKVSSNIQKKQETLSVEKNVDNNLDNIKNQNEFNNYLKSDLSHRQTQWTQDILKKNTNKDFSNRAAFSILKDEDRSIGQISAKNKWLFFKMRGGVHTLLIDFFILIIINCINFASQYSMQNWASQKPENRKIKDFLLIIIISMSGVQIFQQIRQIYNACLNYKQSTRMNFLLHFALIYASINLFWNRVPIGRVINRAASDIDNVQQGLSVQSGRFFGQFANTLQRFIICTYSSNNLLWIAIFLNQVLCIFLYKYFMKAQIEVNRVNSIVRSPINQFFGESLNGLVVIRAYGIRKKILEDFYDRIDINRSLRQITYGLNCWFQLRFKILSMLITIPGFIFVLQWSPPAGIVGLLITNILVISSTLSNTMDIFTVLETKFVSWERINTFMNIEHEEGYADINQVNERFRKGVSLFEKSDDFESNLSNKDGWIDKGSIEFNNVNVKYKKELDFVLKNVSFLIEGGQKIGIVGKTGAGKSTLLDSIVKIFKKYDGKILIDNKEINKIDLKQLRRSITYIQQDPYLFQDTIRKNLDHLGIYDDEAIIQVLKDVDIYEKFENSVLSNIEQTVSVLDFKIDVLSKNLSVGEKQLLCLARTLLKKNKIIQLDEATSNLDIITEKKIQKVIQEKFNDSTMLIIAHRLETIQFCDKIMVMEKGEIVEFDDIEAIKNNPESSFGQLLVKYHKNNN